MSSILYKKNIKYFILLIVPTLGLYLFSLVGPLFIGTIPMSFRDWNIFGGDKGFNGISNYIKLMSDQGFIDSLIFTAKLALFTILGTNILAFSFASLLNANIYARSISRSMFFIPNIISGIMVAFIWEFILTAAIPPVLEFMGLDFAANISWFGSSGMAMTSIIIVNIWQVTGFLMVLYIAGFQTISIDIIEAAKLDGCIGLNKVFRIQIPLLMQTITINLFVSIAIAFKAFDIPFALTGGGPGVSTQTVSINIYKDAFSTFNIGYSSAKSMVLFFIVAVIVIIQLTITRKREVEI
jgi:raffinose/stachyose/melibiose transport system permease protein